MHALFVFVLLALGLAVALKAFDAVVQVHLDSRLDAIKEWGLASLAAWALNYSVFSAFGVSFRAAWLGVVATGAALVAGGKVLDVLVGWFKKA